jgi:hypothetical protein
MLFYEMFGGLLESELEFPELTPTLPGTPDWILRATAAAPPRSSGETLGGDDVDFGVRVRALRVSGGYRLEFDDTGVYEVSLDGREIRWYRTPGVDEQTARTDLCGRVFAVALHASGWLSLHGSAVSLGDRALAFLSSRNTTKTSLAVALANAGAEFMSADMLPVAPIPSPIARPGILSLNMFASAVDWLGIPGDQADTDTGEWGPTFFDNAVARRREKPAALDVIYLLATVPQSADEPAARRTRITGAEAALSVLGNAAVGSLLGKRDAPAILARTIALVGQVPVYRLALARDSARLGEIVDTIFSWHDRVPAAVEQGALGRS